MLKKGRVQYTRLLQRICHNAERQDRLLIGKSPFCRAIESFYKQVAFSVCRALDDIDDKSSLLCLLGWYSE